MKAKNVMKSGKGIGLAGLVLIVIGGWLVYEHFGQGTGQIRNVLLISIDTCRADHLSCYGYKPETTPNIDAVAAEGVLFENAISPIPLTLPSHSSMLTGTIPPFHGVHRNLGYRLDRSNITLAEILKDKGFATGAAISAFVLDSEFGIAQGFDSYQDDFEQAKASCDGAERIGGETTHVALDWLDDHQEEKFFFFLHYFDPHDEYAPPEPFASRFASPYAGEIAYTDDCIGQVIQKLKDLKLYDSTLIIIAGDHGEMLGEHGEDTHGYFIYQGAIRIPLIVKLPGRHNARTINATCGLVDIVPTVCGLLNIEAPENIQGIDLTGTLRGDKAPDQNRTLFCESLLATEYHANSLLGVVGNRFKYIQTTRPELYDLVNDPGEREDLIDQQPQRARKMKDALAAMLEQAVRKENPSGQMELDASARRQLESLGYTGSGPLDEDFSFDQTKDDPKDVFGFYKLAVKTSGLLSAGNYQEATAGAQELIKQKPDCSVGYKKMAQIAEHQERYEQAAAHCRKVVELSPGEVRWSFHLAVMLEKSGMIDEAVANYRNVIKNDADYVSAYYNLGTLFAKRGHYEQAVDCFQQALKLNPDMATTHNNLGTALRDMGNLEEAVQSYQTALKIEPDMAEVHTNLGDIFKRMGKEAQAAEHLERAQKLEPDNAYLQLDLGNTFKAMDQFEQAAEHYRKALALKPDMAEVHYHLGDALQHMGKHAQAVEHFKIVLKSKPDNANAHNNLGLALEKIGDLEQAADHYQKAVQLEPDHVIARYNLGTTLGRLGQFEQAATHFQETLKLKPDHINAHNNLGSALRALGKLEDAAECYRQTLKLKPDYALAHNNLGNTLLALGKPAQAIEHYQTALRLKPDDVGALNSLARILATVEDEGLRDPAQAVRLGQRACELTQYSHPVVLDTLAVAYAADGDFTKAITFAEKTLQLAGDNKGLADEIQKRIEQYQAKKDSY